MRFFHRRQFFTTSMVGAAGAWKAGEVLSQDLPVKPLKQEKLAEQFSNDTLFLSLSGDPTTSVTIQWLGLDFEVPAKKIQYAELTPELERFRVLSATPVATPKRDLNDWDRRETLPMPARQTVKPVWQEAAITKKPFPLTELNVYRVTLENLKPGTEYLFRVGSISPECRFRTQPAKATDTFQFISGGDCGVNSHAINNNILAAKQDPYFIIITGDLGYDNGRSAKTAIQFIRNYAKHAIDSKGRLVPLVVGIGNHEVNGGYGKSREDAPFYFALFDHLYPENSYTTLDFGDYLSLVILDTGHVSKIGGEQTDWLEKQLKSRATMPHLIAANHVPAYPSYRDAAGKGGKAGTGDEQRKYWVPLFEKHMVDAVLEHHDHTFKRTHPLIDGLRDDAGVVYLGDGSWGMLRPPNPPEVRPYLAAVGGSYHFSIHRLEGAMRYHLAMEEGGKLIDLYSTRKKPRG
jgi:acid phosphatase type 7